MQLSGKVLSQHTLEFEPQHHKINKISKLISTVWSQESQVTSVHSMDAFLGDLSY
jgi:hypothetical protein